ncbi:MAG: hypothetical protein JNL92_07010 [Opitutaceae bacterium]|nr:hypothetical protein [Opitutaceae bacterium]
MVSPVFAQLLRSGREHFNARFAAARRVTPGLDAAGFTAFLAGPVDGVVQAVEKAVPGRGADVAQAAYDLALELAGQRLFGGGRGRWIEAGWQQLLPGVPGLIATDPVRLLGATTNALHTLAATPGARPGEWIDLLTRFGPVVAGDAAAWLALGQVAAWRAGLAHFRAPALQLADSLPPAVALGLVGASPEAAWSDVAAHLRRDPWYDPATGPAAAGRLRLAGTAGAFRGFGGAFVSPPRVAFHADHFQVQSGADRWVLTADAWGATLHRARPDEPAGEPGDPALGGRLRVRAGGVAFAGGEVNVPDLGEVTSAAASATTLALTTTLTHRVLLFALPPR